MSNDAQAASTQEQVLTPGNKKAKLVTVHGTGAGDVTSSGDKWWQLGSVFLTDLQTRLELDPKRVEIVPFQWDVGPNSEEKRRAAGNKLKDLLHSYDKAGDDYYLVGHSHGGSVIYHSLLQSVADKMPFAGLKTWCTVGTPFLDYRPNTFLFQRLKSIGLTFCTSGIVSFVLGLWIMLMTITRESVNQSVIEMGHAMLIYGAIIYSILWVYERRKKTWFTRAQKKEVEQIYKDRWCGLWHQEDEAISALSNVKAINAPIIPHTFLQQIISSIQFAVVIIIGVYYAADLAFFEGEQIGKLAEFFLEDTEGGLGWLTYMTTFMIAVYILAFWVLIKGLSVLALALGRPLAFLLNNVVWASIKQRAWGDDLLKEDVHSVSSQPPEFAHTCDFLCETIASPLREHSEKNAIKTLHKVRMVLGMTENASRSPDLRTELSESLNWQELIHTSYFEVPAFVDLLAKNLIDAGINQYK
ncbi:hypothetical protein KJ365_06975 [Glaciecola sp. XM2]|uniref:hypothetical protein n=1 Tax=Glaciecola sp. XM2 TaxID=1914931 RepID=UPI001BDF60C7|nr:hypothetical protein [Glaciecola sp. XM2]MBT1450622.1 hypothetical protein [Glaciecola sp. XM2]